MIFYGCRICRKSETIIIIADFEGVVNKKTEKAVDTKCAQKDTKHTGMMVQEVRASYVLILRLILTVGLACTI